jgi:hypothetical protein
MSDETLSFAEAVALASNRLGDVERARAMVWAAWDAGDLPWDVDAEVFARQVDGVKRMLKMNGEPEAVEGVVEYHRCLWTGTMPSSTRPPL